jgi:hypothetical protein
MPPTAALAATLPLFTGAACSTSRGEGVLAPRSDYRGTDLIDGAAMAADEITHVMEMVKSGTFTLASGLRTN